MMQYVLSSNLLFCGYEVINYGVHNYDEISIGGLNFLIDYIILLLRYSYYSLSKI